VQLPFIVQNFNSQISDHSILTFDFIYSTMLLWCRRLRTQQKEDVAEVIDWRSLLWVDWNFKKATTVKSIQAESRK